MRRHADTAVLFAWVGEQEWSTAQHRHLIDFQSSPSPGLPPALLPTVVRKHFCSSSWQSCFLLPGPFVLVLDHAFVSLAHPICFSDFRI